jgi:MFS family permease
MDKIGRKCTGTASSVGMGLGFLVVGAAGGYLGLVAAAAVLGWGNGMSAGLIMTLGADLAPADRRGESIGVFRVIT